MKKLAVVLLTLVVVVGLSSVAMACNYNGSEKWEESCDSFDVKITNHLFSNTFDVDAGKLDCDQIRGEVGYYVFDGDVDGTEEPNMPSQADDKWGDDYSRIHVEEAAHGEFWLVSNGDVEVTVSFKPGTWFDVDDYFFEVVNYLRASTLLEAFDEDTDAEFTHTFDASGANADNPNQYTIDLAILIPEVEKYEAQDYDGTVKILVEAP